MIQESDKYFCDSSKASVFGWINGNHKIICHLRKKPWKVCFNCLYFLVAVVHHKAAWIPFNIPRFYYSQGLRNSIICLILESKWCNNRLFNVCFNNQEGKGNSVLSCFVSSVEKNYLLTIFLNQVKLCCVWWTKKQASCSWQFSDLQWIMMY